MTRALRVYVAGSSKEMDRAKQVIASLLIQGVEVTSRWIAAIEKAGMANEGLGDDVARNAALDNVEDIDRADALLLLMPLDGHYSHGALWELGYATGIQKHTVVAGNRERSVFSRLATARIASDVDAISSLVRLAEDLNRGEAQT